MSPKQTCGAEASPEMEPGPDMLLVPVVPWLGVRESLADWALSAAESA